MAHDCTAPKNLFWVHVSLWLANFIGPFLYTGMNNVLPSIATEFNTPAIGIAFLVILFAYSQSFFGTVGGKMGDLFGLRKMMNIGYIVCILTIIGIFLSPNFTVLSIVRFIQGIGTAFLMSCSTAIAISINPVSRRGAILGMLMSASYLGLSLGPITAGTITTFVEWRMFFIFLLIPCLFGFILFRVNVPTEFCESENEHFDIKGSLLLGLGLGFVSLGTGLFVRIPWMFWFLPLGAVILFFFVRFELKEKEPLIKFEIFKRTKNFRLGIISTYINFASTSSIIYFIVLYFQQVREFTPMAAGAFMFCNTIPQFLLTPYAGKLSDRIRPEYIVVLGQVLCIFSLINMAFLSFDSNLIYVGCILACTGAGVALFSAPCTVSSFKGIHASEVGFASGLAGTSRSAGLLFGQLIIALIISHYLGTQTVTEETAHLFLSSMKASLLLLAGFTLLCTLAYVRFIKQLKAADTDAL